MVSLYVIGLLVMLCSFSLVKFKFMSVLLLLEKLKILLLLMIFLFSLYKLYMIYLIFMVVATIEVTLALVSLTRLWDSDCLFY